MHEWLWLHALWFDQRISATSASSQRNYDLIQIQLSKLSYFYSFFFLFLHRIGKLKAALVSYIEELAHSQGNAINLRLKNEMCKLENLIKSQSKYMIKWRISVSYFCPPLNTIIINLYDTFLRINVWKIWGSNWV